MRLRCRGRKAAALAAHPCRGQIFSQRKIFSSIQHSNKHSHSTNCLQLHAFGRIVSVRHIFRSLLPKKQLT